MTKLIYSGEELAVVVLDTPEEIRAVTVAVNIALAKGLDRSLADPLENLRTLLTA